MDSESVWKLAWRAWKVILLSLGTVVVVGIFSLYFQSFLLPIVLLIFAGITIFLYRKVAQDVRNR